MPENKAYFDGYKYAVRGRSLLRAGLITLIVLHCLPLWMFQYIPTQDGPAHLHNALVLANYSRVPIYREYYEAGPTRAGNFITHYALALLCRLLPPLIALKVFLTSYVILLPLALWYALAALAPEAEAFAFLSFSLIYNYFFHMGFWNFCLGVSLLLFAVGYTSRRMGRWTWPSASGLAVLLALIYSCHLLAWGLTVAYVVTAVFATILQSPQGPSATRTVLKQSFLPLLAILPAAVPALLYLAQTANRSGLRDAALAEPWVATQPLSGFTALENWLGKTWLVLLATLVLAALVHKLRTRRLERWDHLVIVASVFAGIALFAPVNLGPGAYVKGRVALCLYFVLILWVASIGRRWRLRSAAAVTAAALSIFAIAARITPYRNFNGALREYSTIEAALEPDSTLLDIHFRPDESIDPTLHALGLITSKPFIDLRNYEATTDHFVTRFRPGRFLLSGWGSLANCEFGDFRRFADLNRKLPVDYILLSGWPPGQKDWLSQIEKELTAYRLVMITHPRGLVRVYRRAGP